MRIGTFQLNAKARKPVMRVLASLLAVLLAVFCFHHFLPDLDGGVQTMLVSEDSIELSVAGEAVLFREEVAVSSSYSGLTVPLVSPGAHVSKDCEIATVYGSGAEYREAYALLSEQIDVLKAAENENDTLSGLSDLKKEIDALSLRLVSSLEQGNSEAVRPAVEQLRVLSCRVQALTDSDFSLSTLISALESERDAILSRAGTASETLKASASGYYYPNADASYALCSVDQLETLTPSGLARLRDSLRNADSAPLGAGTMVRSAEWYIAVQVDLSAEELSSYLVGGTYPVVFSENSDERIPMKLVRTEEGTDETPAMLILSTLRMPDGFSFERLQKVRIVTGSMSGYTVPKRAVHTLNGVRGVYVLDGSEVCFSRIEILYELDSRYLVKTTDPTPDGEYAENVYRYIALYDAMILSDAPLSHGQILS
ncbi:MAG: hypothetical protein IKC26_11640 [Clostridia bacterium]|nr:hypothetical protein [Clostridia bacterium]MBR2908680.1 hypothetical protein [Clostridia bacterium]